MAAAVVPVAAETAEVTGAADVTDPEPEVPEVTGPEVVPAAAAVVLVTVDTADVTAKVAGRAVEAVRVSACACRENTSKRTMIPAAMIATVTARRAMTGKIGCGIDQLPHHGDRPDPARVPAISGPKHAGAPCSRPILALGHPEPDICDPPRMYCSATTVQQLPESGKGLRMPAAELTAKLNFARGSKSCITAIIKDHPGLAVRIASASIRPGRSRLAS